MNNQCRTKRGRLECKDDKGKWVPVGKENAKSNSVKKIKVSNSFKKSRTNVC